MFLASRWAQSCDAMNLRVTRHRGKWLSFLHLVWELSVSCGSQPWQHTGIRKGASRPYGSDSGGGAHTFKHAHIRAGQKQLSRWVKNAMCSQAKDQQLSLCFSNFGSTEVPREGEEESAKNAASWVCPLSFSLILWCGMEPTNTHFNWFYEQYVCLTKLLLPSALIATPHSPYPLPWL